MIWMMSYSEIVEADRSRTVNETLQRAHWLLVSVVIADDISWADG